MLGVKDPFRIHLHLDSTQFIAHSFFDSIFISLANIRIINEGKELDDSQHRRY